MELTRRAWSLLIAMGGVALSSCASQALHVDSVRAPGITFDQYRTYAWVSVSGRKAASNPLNKQLDQQVKSAVEKELKDHGLKRVTIGNPDLLIRYSAAARETEVVGRPSQGYFGPPAAFPVRRAALGLQFLDAKTMQVVWQGIATQEFEPKEQVEPIDVAEAVHEIIQKYPTA